MGYFSEEFLKKQEEHAGCDNLNFTDEELVQIYNALGYTICILKLSNNVLQNDLLLEDIEDENRFLNAIRIKIGSELASRNCLD